MSQDSLIVGFVVGFGIGLIVLLGTSHWADDKLREKDEIIVELKNKARNLEEEHARQIMSCRDQLEEEAKQATHLIEIVSRCDDEEERERRQAERTQRMLDLCYEECH